ncbi:hypothetical protein PR202_ga01813 [Eleusine coracana subsp. coracana]|uniref:DUF7595 domain-containing protein n=1 Tax=Eleusine coracana subsp. coracana TaxID=191504 RepID=A0AAV5BI76_ELECO|nr:hypothetical protein PR202_ga01126 [Eleusine coracana subsp. coracana]GJM85996.1 hypothetical protein PR202_ga01813 [Eleusine coracana subsp. coracana]
MRQQRRDRAEYRGPVDEHMDRVQRPSSSSSSSSSGTFQAENALSSATSTTKVSLAPSSSSADRARRRSLVRRGYAERVHQSTWISEAIFSRVDLITLLRCAAASKPLRRLITDPVFHDHLRRNADSRFVPSLLVGIFFPHSRDEARRFLRLPPSGAIATDTLPRFVSCRRLLPSLLDVTPLVHVLAGGVTRRPRRAAPIIVFLPTATLYGYSHVVVLSGDGHDSFHFELLVLDGEARTQTFSSATGAWGPVTEHLAKASRCLRRRRREVPGELLLVRSVDGRLGLLVAEALAMAVWTLSEDSRSWARRVVVDRARMLRPLTLRYNPLACLNFELEWFGETSGTVVLQLQGAGILLLQLQTGEVNQLRNQDEHNLLYYNDPQPLGCCPYEMNMVSVLSAMRKF